MNHTCDSLFVAYHSLWLDLKEDTLSWKQLDSLQTLQIRAIASIESSVQDYALAVLELIGDTVIVRFPEENTEEESARYAFKEKAEEERLNPKKIQSAAFTIFPNPNSGLFNIKLNELSGDLRVQVNDLTGRVVFNSEYPVFEKNEVSLDLSHLTKGIYLCSVYVDNSLSGIKRIVFIK